MSIVYLQKQECHTNDDIPQVGELATDFCLVSNQLQEKTLANYSGSSKLIYAVPSLDTMVCANTTKTLNELIDESIASHQENMKQAVVLVVSADLPFAQQRFCKQNKLKNITMLSMMRDRQFASDYGILLIDGPLAGLATRSIFVLDSDNKIQYSELVNDITHEPDFNLALRKL